MNEFKSIRAFWFMHGMSTTVPTVRATSDRFSDAHISCTVSTKRGYLFFFFFWSFVTTGIRRVGLLWRIMWGTVALWSKWAAEPVSDAGLWAVGAPADDHTSYSYEGSSFINRKHGLRSVVSSSFSRPQPPPYTKNNKNLSWNPTQQKLYYNMGLLGFI